ncbi:MAG: hypothetical protein HY301_02105 [Verrucomicrobia bacterium]|nr:hypothetical protein [Verrucomicrobiota bacterium]
MKRFFLWLPLLAALAFAPAALRAAEGKIVKVLPHYLDEKGRHTLAPSLYERDAYQSHLRKHRDLCSALRYDIEWKAGKTGGAPLKLRLELRAGQSAGGEPLVLEEEVKPPKFFSRWTSLTLGGEAFKKAGDVAAWRATLWAGDTMVAEQKSFLW